MKPKKAAAKRKTKPDPSLLYRIAGATRHAQYVNAVHFHAMCGNVDGGASLSGGVSFRDLISYCLAAGEKHGFDALLVADAGPNNITFAILERTR